MHKVAAANVTTNEYGPVESRIPVYPVAAVRPWSQLSRERGRNKKH